jgi:hypothetical protein
MTAISREELRKRIIIFRRNLIGLRKLSGKNCRENRNTRFMSITFSPKCVPLLDYCMMCDEAKQIITQ